MNVIKGTINKRRKPSYFTTLFLIHFEIERDSFLGANGPEGRLSPSIFLYL